MALPAILQGDSLTRLQQGSFIEKGGWATMPGGEPANAAVAEACATMLGSLQK
jgi:hypothetical protein